MLLTQPAPSRGGPTSNGWRPPLVSPLGNPGPDAAASDAPGEEQDAGTTGRGGRPRPRLWLAIIDTWAGMRDGRRGLPVVAGDTVHGTPRLEEIHTECRAHLDRLRRAVITASAADYAREVELAEHVLPRAKERLAEAELRLEAARSAGIIPGRRLGEDHLPQDLVERRRDSEASRRVSRAMKRVEDERTEVRKAHGELEATRRRLQHRTHEAFAQAEQVHAWASRRATRYLHAAQRRHSDRAGFAGAFTALMPPPPTRNQWVAATQMESL